MESQDRQYVVQQLASSEAKLLCLVDGLSEAQWNFHETPDRWSIAENLEHLIVHEKFIGETLQRVLAGPPEVDKKSSASTKDARILRLATSRDTKITAREVAQPTGRWTDPRALVDVFREARAQTITFAATTGAPLRDHFFPHLAFGDLDCYQWLVAIAHHTLRHAAQIEEIKADPAYPVYQTS